MHWLEQAFQDGLHQLDLKELMAGTIEHNSVEGEWETGVVSPSLCAKECRLARLKTFIGHAAQPGLKRMAVRQGVPDAVSVLNFLRGFLMEGVIVTALREVLGDKRIIGHAPSLLFRWPYGGQDPLLAQGLGGRPLVFAGHPDLLVWSPKGEMELVQIKCPSIFKLERVAKLGVEDALQSYRAQMATEIYIGRMMGYPIVRTNLLLSTWEGTPRMSKVGCVVVPLDWHPSLATIPLQVARELAQDHAQMELGYWPEAMPEHKWDSWPCSYCNFSRIAGERLIGCTEQQEWDRHARTGETRVSVLEQQAETMPSRRRPARIKGLARRPFNLPRHP